MYMYVRDFNYKNDDYIYICIYLYVAKQNFPGDILIIYSYLCWKLRFLIEKPNMKAKSTENPTCITAITPRKSVLNPK